MVTYSMYSIGMDTMIPNAARVDTVELGLGRLAMLYHSLL